MPGREHFLTTSSEIVDQLTNKAEMLARKRPLLTRMHREGEAQMMNVSGLDGRDQASLHSLLI